MAPGLGVFLRLLGGSDSGATSAPRTPSTYPTESYNDYDITPAPRREDDHWLVAGVIVKEDDTGIRKHRFLRGDRYPDAETAAEFSIFKAKQMIDAEGDRIFRRADAP